VCAVTFIGYNHLKLVGAVLMFTFCLSALGACTVVRDTVRGNESRPFGVVVAATFVLVAILFLLRYLLALFS
jgi:hypothetical protein